MPAGPNTRASSRVEQKWSHAAHQHEPTSHMHQKQHNEGITTTAQTPFGGRTQQRQDHRGAAEQSRGRAHRGAAGVRPADAAYRTGALNGGRPGERARRGGAQTGPGTTGSDGGCCCCRVRVRVRVCERDTRVLWLLWGLQAG